MFIEDLHWVVFWPNQRGSFLNDHPVCIEASIKASFYNFYPSYNNNNYCYSKPNPAELLLNDLIYYIQALVRNIL